MASMNNWLAFSLSPQELPSQHEHQDHTQSSVSRLAFNSDEISGTDVSGGCYHLPSDSTTLPPPFGILEAFQRNHHHQSHDWNMTGLGLSSDMLMAAGGSCSGQNLENQEPKLENFLGGHSFSDHDHSKIQGSCNANNSNIAAAYDGDHYNMYSSSLHLPSDDQTRSNGDGGGNSNSSIGLSMIKTWLRNQPPPPAEGKADGSGAAANGTLTSTQTLSLSMSTGGAAESSSSDTNKQNKATTGGGAAVDSQAAAAGGGAAAEAVPRKSIDTFGQRTSIYRGVTRHRWTGRYEAHLWDNSCRREGQTRKGRQVYLGGYDKEDKAARAYDLAALKYWGTTTTTNFPITTYEKELEEMKHMTRQEYVASLRRKSSGFSRGASIYRGVTRHHQHGRWQARIGRVAGNKDLYLGTFSTQEEAAEAYDIAAIKFRGLNAVTNFDMSRYDVKSILESSTLPIGGAAKRLKDAEQADLTVVDAASSHRATVADDDSMTSHLTDGISNYAGGWPTIAFQNPPPPPFSVHYSPYSSGHHRAAAAAPGWCKQEQDSFQDYHHLQLGSTHNFFQNNNLMIPDNSSMEHSSGSNNSVIYGGGADQYGGNNGNVNYMIPMSSVVATDHQHHNNGFGDGGEVKPLGYDHAAVYGGANDPYQARNLYYLSQQSNGAKAAAYDQGSACNNWVPTAVPTLAPARTNNMAVCHGAQTFTVWNDT